MSTRGPSKRFLIREMDQSVKRMLQLIGEEGDSFAKKAEIYIQKRPILVAQVEDFYRMFRSLAEHYENATSELRRVNALEMQSQRSSVTDFASEPPSAMTSPEHRLSRRLSGIPTACFDMMGNNATGFDSESDSDDSFFNTTTYTYSSSLGYGNYKRLRKKAAELEAALKRLRIEQEIKKSSSELVADYEEQLRVAKENIKSSEKEIGELKAKLEKYESMEPIDDFTEESVNRICALEEKLDGAEEDVKRLRQELDTNGEVRDDPNEMRDVIEQLRLEREDFIEKVNELEEEIRLKDDQLEGMNDRLNKLYTEYEECRKSIEELKCQGRELEEVVEKQRKVIEEGDEEKQQAVSQLVFSLEHYRNAYKMLRKNLLEHKTPVMAS
uniref:protein NETWORKED 4A-like n=1 Tax=Erigeron canadensis TaxID=72917 RepID=UPI001CB8FD25|nr:protein NETWORKED 4A-like [Erigeron canadensis]